ncbi:MAG TPA: EamA family transporter, partial [Magnetospirillum sp.]|nr:EamA family transporter [Magnetospirillum sp.]
MTATAATTRAGALAAIGAFLCWGVFGLYFKALAAIPTAEVLAHRVLGGALFTLLLLAAMGKLGEVRSMVADRRTLVRLGASALAVALNWGAFMWAVVQGRALEGSLGYYVFPLISVLLGRLFLGEQLGRRQIGAIALVVVGVGWQIAQGHGVPWIALTVAVTFGAYGLLRKTIAVP